MVVVAVIIDVVDGAIHLAHGKGFRVLQIQGNIKVEGGGAKLLVMQLANVDAVSSDGACQEMFLVVSQVVGGTSHTSGHIALGD